MCKHWGAEEIWFFFWKSQLGIISLPLLDKLVWASYNFDFDSLLGNLSEFLFHSKEKRWQNTNRYPCMKRVYILIQNRRIWYHAVWFWRSYWSLLWQGGGKVLAEAIYKQARAINKDFLSGRTIGGLAIELLGHWAAYLLTKENRVRVALSEK